MEPHIAERPIALDEQNKYIRTDGCIGTLTTDGSLPKHNNRIIEEDERVRRLTPLECFRLMGFTDEDFFKVKKALNETFYNGKDRSNSQLYKLAGNSISVPMLEFIFCQMFDDNNEIWV